jgi:hypothetical protein
MIVFRPLMAVAALALASSAAYAFQEQRPAQDPGAAPAAKAVETASVEFDSPVAGKGTPVRIPGLGTLGVIPKMDFGLELLYGVTDPANPPKRTDPKNSEVDDVLIRGTIKHKF